MKVMNLVLCVHEISYCLLKSGDVCYDYACMCKINVCAHEPGSQLTTRMFSHGQEGVAMHRLMGGIQ